MMHIVLKDFLAACFMACENWSSVLEKYWHIYATTLYSLKTGWMSIFVCQDFRPTLKQLLTKQELGCVFRWSSKLSSFDTEKAL